MTLRYFRKLAAEEALQVQVRALLPDVRRKLGQQLGTVRVPAPG